MKQFARLADIYRTSQIHIPHLQTSTNSASRSINLPRLRRASPQVTCRRFVSKTAGPLVVVMGSSVPPIAGGMPLDKARAEMVRHFKSFKGDNYAEGWSKLWEKGDCLPWDRGFPSPALVDTLVNHKDVIGGPLVDGRRKKALVPGCGRGVDVILLQSFGYDVVGLEISPGAVAACLAYAKENEDANPAVDEKVGKGSIKFVYGDFYKDDWLKEAGLVDGQRFDLIYDYTFFCAMEPSMRPAWAKRHSELLQDSPQANLICLEFPTDKPLSAGGPPFSSPSKSYMAHLSHPGVDVPYDEAGKVQFNPLAESSPGALDRVGYFNPADTHAAGKDEAGNVKDFISIWRHH